MSVSSISEWQLSHQDWVCGPGQLIYFQLCVSTYCGWCESENSKAHIDLDLKFLVLFAKGSLPMSPDSDARCRGLKLCRACWEPGQPLEMRKARSLWVCGAPTGSARPRPPFRGGVKIQAAESQGMGHGHLEEQAHFVQIYH